ncbi:MAG: lysoplasmalogenase family protein [Thermoflexales bacterium]
MNTVLAILVALFVLSNVAAFAFGKLNEDRTRRSIPWLQRSTSLQLVVIAALIALSRSRESGLQEYAFYVALGMGASFGADLIMAAAGKSTGRLIAGMGVFAIAHSFYLIAMSGEPAQQGPLPIGIFLASLVALLAIGILIWSRWVRVSHGPDVRNYGALGYMVILSTMTAVAIALAYFDRRWWALGLGALLFLASDAVLGNQIFRRNRWPYSSDVVWGLYIAGQAGIVLSTLAATR